MESHIEPHGVLTTELFGVSVLCIEAHGVLTTELRTWGHCAVHRGTWSLDY